MPNLKLQFIVGVDASEVGAGAILFHDSSEDNKVHPCAYFSCKLSDSECHDVGMWFCFVFHVLVFLPL